MSSTTRSTSTLVDGCKILSITVTLRGESWTLEASKTSPPTSLGVIDSAISLLVSACGLVRFGSPDGPTIDPSGRARVLASLSARQAKAAGLMTSGTYG